MQENTGQIMFDVNILKFEENIMTIDLIMQQQKHFK